VYVFAQNFKRQVPCEKKKGSIFLAFSVRLVIHPDSSSRGPQFRFSNLRVSCLIDVYDLPHSLQVNAGIAS
jgi:hypothetical protein